MGLGSEVTCAQAEVGALAYFVPHDYGEGHSGLFMSKTDPGLGPKDTENHSGRNRARSACLSAPHSSQETAVYLGEVLCWAGSQFPGFTSPPVSEAPQEVGPA